MALIRLDPKGLPDTIRIDQLHRQQVVVGNGRRVHDAERVFAHGLDGTPDVDDLIAAFEEAVGVGGEMVSDAVGAGFVGLVDVDALDGAAGSGGVVGLAGEAVVGG